MMAVFRTLRLVALGLSLTATGLQARTLEVGAGKDYKQPSEAVAAAKDGDVIRIHPGEYFDCAIVRPNKLTIEGVGDPDKVIMTDKACNGKGLFVTAGENTTIRNMTLMRARVPDGNGAGIRADGGDLTIDGVRFINNQNGILFTPGHPSALTIRNSLFDRNGTCPNGNNCAHGVYVSSGTLLHVENTKFIGTKQGHHIKSRALRTEVIGCTIEDGDEGTASYLIEVPNGGTLIVRDNTMQKGPKAENHSAAIILGAEGVTQPTREITIENNTFRNDGDWTTVFVNNITATDAILRGNRLSGSTKALTGDGQVTAAR